jgi:hypothetical protein
MESSLGKVVAAGTYTVKINAVTATGEEDIKSATVIIK